MRRRTVKVHRSPTVVMLLLLGVTYNVIRKVIREKCVLTGWRVMAITRTMAMQLLFKMIMNHVMFWWFLEEVRERQVALGT